MNILDIVISDIIIKIASFLNTFDKLKFLSITNDLHLLKNRTYYDKRIAFHKIYKLWYYDRFTNIVVGKSGQKYKLPTSIIKLTFRWNFKNNIKEYIPNSITHLTLSSTFNKDIEGCIPNSVTHLTFGNVFNQNIKDCIPNSVTHLTFGNAFNQNIKDCIPNSVTHLTFGYNFNQ